MASLDPALARILIRIANADGGAHHRFQPFFADQSDAPVRVLPAIDGIDELLPGPMRALAELGFLNMEPAETGEFGEFQLTASGRDAAARSDTTGRQSASPVDLSWVNVLPVLLATVEQWEQAGGSEAVDIYDIVRTLGEEGSALPVSRALEALEADGWVTLEHEMGTSGPIAAAPLPKALSQARGWPAPGATDVVTHLLRALDEAIETTADPEEKSRLQRLRAAAADVGKSVLAGAIVAAGKAAAGG